MINYINVKFQDKLGNIFIFRAEANQTIKDFLYRNKIPSNSVVVKRNGEFVSEDIKIKEGDEIFIEMVRGYDLPYFREIKTEIEKVENPIYTKRMLWFDRGEVRLKIKQFTEKVL
jgi:sulfur carrier protein ThiS